MKKHILKIGLTLLIMLLPTSMLAVKIVSWNVLDFYGALSTDRIEDFRAVMDELQPDILIVQDIGDAEGVNLFLNDVLNHSKKLYRKAKFTNQDGTQSALFYNKKTIKFNSVEEITTLSRSVWGYKVKIRKGEGKGKLLYLYSVHLAEGTTAAAKNSRDADAELIRDYLNNKHKSGDYFLVCGTFNLAGVADTAFKKLTADANINNGRLYDPLDLPGKWHRKKKVAITHTESTRRIKSGMGASGGLDDRYDNFFISEGIAEDKKFTYKDDSYVAYGNDGKHFKKAVTTPANKVVSQDVAEALYRASDHLPIIIELGEPGGDPPIAPSELTAEALSSATVKLDWKDNSDNEDGFHLYRAGDCLGCHGESHCSGCHGGFPGIPNSPVHEMGGHYHSWAQLQTMNSNVKTYNDSSVSGGVTYKYKVRAFNSAGNSGYSNTATVKTNTASASSKNQEK